MYIYIYTVYSIYTFIYDQTMSYIPWYLVHSRPRFPKISKPPGDCESLQAPSGQEGLRRALAEAYETRIFSQFLVDFTEKRWISPRKNMVISCHVPAKISDFSSKIFEICWTGLLVCRQNQGFSKLLFCWIIAAFWGGICTFTSCFEFPSFHQCPLLVSWE